MDIATTCTRRSNLFHKTFDSFERRLFGTFIDHRLVANIDPVGSEDSNLPMLKEIGGFFGNRVKLRMPEHPDFMSAFMHVWLNADSDLVFGLEDDWLCLREFDLDKMVSIMDKNKDLAFLRLSSWGTTDKVAKQWNKEFPWNGEFFECPNNLKTSMGFCGHPGIFRRKFIRQILAQLSPIGGPEKQINNSRNPDIMHILMKWRYGVFSEQNGAPGVRDLGRKWKQQNGFKKDSATRFKKWIPNNS